MWGCSDDAGFINGAIMPVDGGPPERFGVRRGALPGGVRSVGLLGYRRGEVSAMDVQPPGGRLERMPAKVKWAVAGLWFEVVLFAFGIAGLFMQAHDRTSHGQEGAGPLVMGGLILVPVAAVWGWCAVMAARRAYWARLLAAILQACFILGGAITLVIALALADPIGVVVALVFLAVPVGIASLMLVRGSREWYTSHERPPRVPL